MSQNVTGKRKYSLSSMSDCDTGGNFRPRQPSPIRFAASCLLLFFLLFGHILLLAPMLYLPYEHGSQYCNVC